MPLSEDEQKILNEIESQFYESDPRLAKEVKSTTVYSKHIRALRWSIVAFAVGILVMVLTLSTHFLLAASGFLIMLVSALYFEQNLRQLGKTGISQRKQKAGGELWSVFGKTGQKMRDRFQTDQDR